MSTQDPLRRFRDAVRTWPSRTAVVAPDRRLTFAALADEVARIAGLLAEANVGRGDLVGIHVGRESSLVAALLAVWARGAAYVPLDPVHPGHRLHAIARDARVGCVLTTAAWPENGVDVRGVPAATSVPDVGTDGLDSAYVIHTSGSTGVPKGVVVTRRAVAELVSALEATGTYPPEPAVVAWNASVSFDASVQQWLRVCRGDTLVLLDEDTRTDPAGFMAVLEREGVTDLDVTPSHWAALAPHLPTRFDPPLRLLVGGEPIPAGMWRELATHPGVTARNLYGPTECTVDAVTAGVEGDHPTIGHPLPGVRAYVLDDGLAPVPVGVTGELVLAGACVARGYLGRPAETAARFVPDPFTADGERMYRTGDLVVQRADGALDYVRRADRQVKVRGHRVEPAEIESVLDSHPAVAASHVRVDDDGRLAAYCVVTDEVDLREHAAGRLPAYMVPEVVIPLPELPRTVNGKVDEQALAAHRQSDTSADLPSDPLERLIGTAWSHVLGIPTITTDDDFFDLGGHSLTAIRLVSTIRSTLGITIATRDVYRHPRLRDLAEHIARTYEFSPGRELDANSLTSAT